MKHQAWRHDPAAYGPPQPAPTRFADVDTRRHVNNIAVHGLHQEARQRWLMAAGGAAVWPEGTLRLKPVHCRTEFWRECHYPAPVSAGLRLLGGCRTWGVESEEGSRRGQFVPDLQAHGLTRGRTDGAKWTAAADSQPTLPKSDRLPGLAPEALTLATGLFQDGACVGMQQTQVGAWDADLGRRIDLPPAWLARLAAAGAWLAGPPGDPSGVAHGDPRDPVHPGPAGSEERAHYPVAAELSSRYGDFDADGGSSEAAVMRGLEQARAALLQQAFAAAGGDPACDWVKLLVARIDLHWVHHRAPPRVWALAGAVSHTGRSSVLLRVALFDGAALQAWADCVMVYTDPAGPAGAQALPAPLRAALQALAWRGETTDA